MKTMQKVSVYTKKITPDAAIAPAAINISGLLPSSGKWLTECYSRRLLWGVVALTIVAAISWAIIKAFWDAQAVLEHNSYLPGMLLLAQITFFLNIAALIWRIAWWMRYRPVPACKSNRRLPRCSVIVPAYNEGQTVFDTLSSLVGSDYPADKLQIITVDDGSRDDTWSWMQKAVQAWPDRIQAIRLKTNQGKRYALYQGILRSQGQIIITVDSDSVVEPQTIRCMVSPFTQHGVGAVAGNVRVLNRHEGVIPQLLEVSFAFSFDFIRAGQSSVDTVMCTPGALSAYRRSLLLRVLPEWLTQTFCGTPAGIGEDRALTNAILRLGYAVHYQSNAVVYTNVPVRYPTLCRMFLRWARSNVRENLAMGRFIFRRFRENSMLGARVNFLLSFYQMLTAPVLWLSLMFSLMIQPDIMAPALVVGATASGAVPAGFYFLRHRHPAGLWAFVYSLFWVAGLSWIGPYALITPHRSKWLTRQLPPARPDVALRPQLQPVN